MNHQLALWKLVDATMTHMHEFGECPFCELGKEGDIGDWTAKHDPDCPLSGYDLTVDLEALRAASGHAPDYPKATPEPPDAEDVLLRSDEIAKVELAGANISVGANVIVVSGEHVGRYGKVLSWRLRDDGRGYQVLLDQRLLPFHHRAEVKS